VDLRHVAKQVLLAERLIERKVRGIQRLTVEKVWQTTKSYRMGLFRSAGDLHRLQKRVGTAKRRGDLKDEVGREVQAQLELEKQRTEAARTAAENAPKTRTTILEIAAAKRQGLWVEQVMKVADKTITVDGALKILKKSTNHLRVTKMDITRNVGHIRAGRDMEAYSSLYERRGRRPTLSAEIEDSLVETIGLMTKTGCVMTPHLVCTIADYMHECDVAGDPALVDGHLYTAIDRPKLGFGKKWLNGFRKRHSGVKIHKLKSKDPKRHNAMNVHALKRHFDQLEACALKWKFARVNPDFEANVPESPRIIWDEEKLNRVLTMDETRIEIDCSGGMGHFKVVTLESHKTAAIQLPTGGFSCSLAACRNLRNEVLGPAFCTKSDFKWKMCAGDAPSGTATVKATGARQAAAWFHNKKGSFDGENFKQFLVRHVKPTIEDLSPENPALMIVDGVPSHLTPDVVKTALDLGIILFILPPHCTHVLQAEDLVNFPVFKRAFTAKKLDHFTRTAFWAYALSERAGGPHGTVNLSYPEKYLMQLLKQPWDDAFSPELIEVGWRTQGIAPFTCKPLWKHFPNWQQTTSEDAHIPEAAVTPSGSPSDVSSATHLATIRKSILSGELFKDSTLANLPIDGRPETINQIIPTVGRIENFQEQLQTALETDRFCTLNDDEIAELCDLLQLCKKSMKSVFLDRFVATRRGRGAAGVGEMTWDKLVERLEQRTQHEHRQPRNPTTALQKVAEYEELVDDIESGRGLKVRLTRAQLVNVLVRMRERNMSPEMQAIPNGANVDWLEKQLRKHWHELYEAHIKLPVLRGPQPRRQNARDDSSSSGNDTDDAHVSSSDNDDAGSADNWSDTDLESATDASDTPDHVINTSDASCARGRAHVGVTQSLRPRRYASGDCVGVENHGPRAQGQNATTDERTRRVRRPVRRLVSQRTPDAPRAVSKRVKAVKPKKLFSTNQAASAECTGDENHGCSKCRGTTCKRCERLRSEGYVMVGRTDAGYPQLRMPLGAVTHK